MLHQVVIVPVGRGKKGPAAAADAAAVDAAARDMARRLNGAGIRAKVPVHARAHARTRT